MNRRCDPNKRDACEDWNKAKVAITSLVVAADGKHIFASMDHGIMWKCGHAKRK
jgi:alpha-tubulin suppressor-like RCC1 family protein